MRLHSSLYATLTSFQGDETSKHQFLRRLQKGDVTRDENPVSHFCVYFAAYDPKEKLVFVGLHRKSGLWLFNGGHMDRGESPEQTVRREIGEEWGIPIGTVDLGHPQLLTLTKITNPTGQRCRFHYDIWYFVAVGKKTFLPDAALLSKEFSSVGFVPFSEALRLTTDPNTMHAVNWLEDRSKRG